MRCRAVACRVSPMFAPHCYKTTRSRTRASSELALSLYLGFLSVNPESTGSTEPITARVLLTGKRPQNIARSVISGGTLPCAQVIPGRSGPDKFEDHQQVPVAEASLRLKREFQAISIRLAIGKTRNSA